MDMDKPSIIITTDSQAVTIARIADDVLALAQQEYARVSMRDIPSALVNCIRMAAFEVLVLEAGFDPMTIRLPDKSASHQPSIVGGDN